MKDFLIILPAFYFCSHPVERLLVGPFKRNFFRTGRCPVERIWEDRKKRNKQTKAIKQLQIKPPALRSIEFLLLSLLPRISHPTSPPPFTSSPVVLLSVSSKILFQKVCASSPLVWEGLLVWTLVPTQEIIAYFKNLNYEFTSQTCLDASSRLFLRRNVEWTRQKRRKSCLPPPLLRWSIFHILSRKDFNDFTDIKFCLKLYLNSLVYH